MFDIQYLMSEWHDKGAILPSGLKHVLKQGMKILGVSVNWKWDRLVTYWLALVESGENKNKQWCGLSLIHKQSKRNLQ